jgi:hypothetical protein
MPFNHAIKHSAPLPTGALPTDIELSVLRQRAYAAQSAAIRHAFKRLVRMGQR